MIIDESLTLFDGYSGITTAGSYPSNIIDLRATANAVLATGSSGMGAASPIYLVITIPTAFVGGTSVEFVVRTSDSLTSGALSSPATLYDTGAILTASLTAGTTVFSGILPISGVKQYIDINAIGVGTFTAGVVSAYLTDNVQSLNIPLYASVAAV